MKKSLLALLLQESTYISGAELGRRLGVSRAAVWKMVEQLRQAGHIIDAASNRGYLLVQEADILGLAEAKRALQACSDSAWALNIHYQAVTDSTNLMAKRAAEKGAPDKSIFLAHDQQKGRGRLGRSWLSQPGQGLAFSLLLRPKTSPENLAPVTLFAGLMAARALECLLAGLQKEGSPEVAIKWPNDIIAVPGGQKLGGILTETLLEENRVAALIIGIGINLGQTSFPPELEKATSVLAQWSTKLRRLDVLAAIMKNFAQAEKDMFQPGAWLPDYRRHCYTLGRQVLLHEGEKEPEVCQALDVDAAGQLLVLDAAGRKKTVRAGEVSVRGLTGYA